MGKRGRGRPRSGQAAGGNPHGRPGKNAGPIGLTAVEGSPDAFELVHPRCVAEMEPDFQEGLELWKAGDPEEAPTPFATRSRLVPRTSGCTSRWAGSLLKSSRIRSSPAGILDTPSSWRARSCQRVSRAAYRGIDRPTRRFTTPSKASSDAFAPRPCPAKPRA